MNEHGTFSWNELMTPDIPAAAAFYKKIFGWEAAHGDARHGSYTEFKLGDRSIGGAMKPPMPGMPSVWGIYFAVDDTDKTVEVAKANGGTVMHGADGHRARPLRGDRRPARRGVHVIK